jgi:hypothetical protein
MACYGIERQGFDSNMRQDFSFHYNMLTKLWILTNLLSSVYWWLLPRKRAFRSWQSLGFCCFMPILPVCLSVVNLARWQLSQSLSSFYFGSHLLFHLWSVVMHVGLTHHITPKLGFTGRNHIVRTHTNVLCSVA